VVSVLLAVRGFAKRLSGFAQAVLRKIIFLVGALFRNAFGHPQFVNVAQEFFTEAAVLVFVFPVLDTIVQFGTKKVTWRLALGSVGVTVFLLFWAGILAKRKS
jgi:hypothetical protein